MSAGEALAQAFVRLRPEAATFKAEAEKQIASVDGETPGKAVGKRFGSGVGGGLKSSIGAISGVLAGAAIVKFGKDSVAAYSDAQESQKRLQDAFERFPALSDTNQGALQKLNSELQKKTKYDDDNIASGQAVLAQFKVTGSQLKETTPLLLDYASRTGKDIPAAAQDVGKALLGNAKALKNIGIKYTATGDRQKDFTNITALMRAQVGGFAQKEGQTAAGQVAIMKNQFGELQETVGSKLVPALTVLVSHLSEMLIFVTQNLNVIGPLLGIIGTLAVAIWAVNTASSAWTAASKAGAIIHGLFATSINAETGATERGLALRIGDTAATVANTVAKVAANIATKAWAAGQWLLNAALNANPIGLVIAAIALLVGGVILAYRNSETFRKIVQALGAALVVAFHAIETAARAVWSALVTAWNAVRGATVAVWNAIRNAVVTAAIAIKNAAVAAAHGVVAGFNFLASLPGKVAGWFGSVLTGARGKLDSLVTFVAGIPARVVRGLGKIGSTLLSAGGDLIGGFIQGIKNKAGDIVSTIKSAITDKLPSFVKKALGIGSPSKVFAEIGRWVPAGMAKGISDWAHLPSQAVAGMLPSVSGFSVGPTSGFPSSAGSQSQGSAAAAMSSARQPVQLVVDGRVLAEVLVDPLGQVISNRPLR